MTKNSTLKLWDLLLKKQIKEKSHNTLRKTNFKPKDETVQLILAYARSVKAVKTSSNESILISLN